MSTTPIDSYVLDVLMADLVGHDRKPSAFIVYLHLTKLAQRKRRDTVGASLQEIATQTGLSKSSVQSAIRHLRKRHLLEASSESSAGEPVRRVLRPWHRATRR
jgi:response regulator of citrate/malate metabolism